MEKVFLAALLLFAVGIASIPVSDAQTVDTQAVLNQYVADLRKNPDDYALREKIIRHVQTMSPVPAIQEEARRHYVMGRTLLKDAKSPQEANEAAGEFRKALAVAPWFPEANRYCGVALGIANRHDEAIAMLKLYIATNPPDARDAQDEIYAMEAKKIKSAKESTTVAVAVKRQNAYEVWLNELDGARFISAPMNDGRIGHERDLRFQVYSINGNAVSGGWIEGVRGGENFKTFPIRQMPFADDTRTRIIQNKQFTLPRPSFLSDQRPCMATISDDGQFITVRCPSSGIPETYTRVK